MRSAVLATVALVAAGCGGSAGTPAVPGGNALTAYGMSIDLPHGWSGRIVIGASGRPVLHAASFPLEANDTDEGQIAEEAMGVNGMYLNVRNLGAGNRGGSLPLQLDSSAFAPATFESMRRRAATADVASGGDLFSVTAVSGGADPPPQPYLEQLNEALTSLQLAAYAPEPVIASTRNAIDGFGLHANVPEGWEGGIGRDQLHAGDDAVDVTIAEHSAAGAGAFVTGRMPLIIGPVEFVHPQGGTGYETGRSFSDAGRRFQLWVRAPERPSSEELGRVNALLASFRAVSGDFYPGRVEPATFAEAGGWHTGSTGPVDIEPDGQSTMTWAATIPYRDPPLQFPPQKTLAALPGDGIIVLVTIEQYGQPGSAGAIPPLSEFQEGGFEGIGTENAPRHTVVELPHYNADIWALFGRDHPTQEQLDRAQAELDRLALPSWPAWNATSAAR